MIIGAKGIAGDTAFDAPYLKEMQRYKPLSAKEEKDLISIMRQDSDIPAKNHARSSLILHNLRLVISIARKYTYSGLPMGDLVEEGIYGLLKAVDRFSPEYNCRFSTYGSWWIKQSIHFAIANHLTNIHIPSYLIEAVVAWKKAANQLANDLQRQPTADEIAEHLSMKKRKRNLVKKALKAVSGPGAYLDIDDPKTASLLVDLNNENSSQENLLVTNLQEEILELLNKINAREAKILRLRYGLRGNKVLTLGEVAARLKLSRERIRQIESSAINKIRQLVSRNHLGTAVS